MSFYNLRGIQHDASRKLLAITVAVGVGFLAPGRPLLADDLEDFERYIDQAIVDYRNLVHETAKNERTKIAPTQVRQGLENAISISQKAMQIGRDEVVADTTSFNAAVGQLDDIVRSVSARWQPGAEVSLAGYEQILHDANDYERQGLTATATLSRIRENLIGMQEYIKQYESFCNRNVPRLKLASLSLTPFSTKRQANSMQIDPSRFMDDPVAKSYAITAGVTTFASGIALYSAVYGWEAAMALFAVEAGSGGVTVGSSSPVGWAILSATVAVGYYVGMWKVKSENEGRERRANEAWAKLLRGITESQAWFARNRQDGPG